MIPSTIHEEYWEDIGVNKESLNEQATSSEIEVQKWIRHKRNHIGHPLTDNKRFDNVYEHRLSKQPYDPFKNFQDFNQAYKCIKHQLTMEAISDIEFAGDLSWKTAKQLRRKIE